MKIYLGAFIILLEVFVMWSTLYKGFKLFWQDKFDKIKVWSCYYKEPAMKILWSNCYWYGIMGGDVWN